MINGQDMKGHECGEHGHLALGEIDHLGGLVDDHHRRGKETVTGANRQSFNQKLS